MSASKPEVARFVRKPFYVDAIQVTASNIDDVAKWCGGKVKRAKPDPDIVEGRVAVKYVAVNVYRPINDRQKQAFVDDWVLKADKGFKVYTNHAFHNSFELIDGVLHDRVTNRSSVTGEFVTAEEVAAHPETTVTEHG
jgi:hypothetical protein